MPRRRRRQGREGVVRALSRRVGRVARRVASRARGLRGRFCAPRGSLLSADTRYVHFMSVSAALPRRRRRNTARVPARVRVCERRHGRDFIFYFFLPFTLSLPLSRTDSISLFFFLTVRGRC